MYSQQVLDHFQNPRGAGDLPDANVIVEVSNPACGDVMRLALRVESSKIVAARFRAKGCVSSIACGSKLVELVQGTAVADARAVRCEQVIEGLGGLPQGSQHAAQLAIDALNAALKQVPVGRATAGR